MAEEENPIELKGAPEGATMDNIDPGQKSSGDGLPTQPVINNEPPKEPQGDDEEFADPNKKPDEGKDDKGKQEDPKSEDENTDEDVVEDYVPTGDPAADGIVSILQEANVDIKVADEIFREAAETGDLSKIDVAKLTELVGKAKADVILIAAQDYYTRTIGSVKATVSAVHEAVGGEKNWGALVKWAQQKQNADPAFKQQVEEYNRMFDLNKTAATMAAKALLDAYNGDSKNRSLTTTIVAGNKSAGGADLEPLSRADYVEQLKAAHDKGDVEEIARLHARRTATRNSN